MKKKKIICSKEKSHNNINSMSGGSLEGMNVLIVSNYELGLLECNDIFEKEATFVKTLLFNNIENGTQCISLVVSELLKQKIEKDFLGPIDVIINRIYLDDNYIFSEEDSEKKNSLELTYRLLQAESDYLVNTNGIKHIVNVCVKSDSDTGNIEAAQIRTMIKGLGKVLGTHRIVINGIIASKNVNNKDVMKIAAFLSSKYGEMLCGETVEMEESMSL